MDANGIIGLPFLDIIPTSIGEGSLLPGPVALIAAC